MNWLKNNIIWLIGGIGVLVLFFRDLIMEYLIKSAKRISNKAKVDDERLKVEIKSAEEMAEEERKKAEEAKKEAETIKVDTNWHKDE